MKKKGTKLPFVSFFKCILRTFIEINVVNLVGIVVIPSDHSLAH